MLGSVLCTLSLANLAMGCMMCTSNPASITLTNSKTTLVMNTADLGSQRATIQGYTETIACVPTKYVGTASWAPTITVLMGDYLPTPICGQVITVAETNPCLTEHNCHSPTIWFKGGATAVTVNASDISPSTYTSMNRSTTATTSTTALTFGTTDMAGSTTSAAVKTPTASETQSGNRAAKTGFSQGAMGMLGLVAGVLFL